MSYDTRLLISFSQVNNRIDKPDFCEKVGDICLQPLRMFCGYTYTYITGEYKQIPTSTLDKCGVLALFVFGVVVNTPLTAGGFLVITGIGFIATWQSKSHREHFALFHAAINPKPSSQSPEVTTQQSDSNTKKEAAPSPVVTAASTKEIEKPQKLSDVSREKVCDYFDCLKKASDEDKRFRIINDTVSACLDFLKIYTHLSDEDADLKDKLHFILECFFAKANGGLTDTLFNLPAEEKKVVFKEFIHCYNPRKALWDAILHNPKQMDIIKLVLEIPLEEQAFNILDFFWGAMKYAFISKGNHPNAEIKELFQDYINSCNLDALPKNRFALLLLFKEGHQRQSKQTLSFELPPDFARHITKDVLSAGSYNTNRDNDGEYILLFHRYFSAIPEIEERENKLRELYTTVSESIN